jgi:DNA-binding NarL/FixJ family response regulator
VTKVEIVDAMPVYAYGLATLLGTHGVAVTGVHSPYPDLEVRRSPDVWIVGPPGELDTCTRSFIATASEVAPLLLVLDELDAVVDIQRMLPHVWGTVRRIASAPTFLRAVCTLAEGGRFTDRDIRERTATPAPDSARDLSAREQQVLELIASGLTHGQVARRLVISPHTVDTYVKRIRSKWDLGNKAELTRAALQMMLVRRTS